MTRGRIGVLLVVLAVGVVLPIVALLLGWR